LIPPDDEGGSAPTPPSEARPQARVGAGTFTIEGRAAPGLFVVGWLGTLLGGVVLFVSLLAGPGVAKLVLFVGGLALLSLGLIAGAGSQGIERRARGRSRYVGPSPILLFIACIPTAAVLLVLLGVPLQLAGFDLDGPPAAVVSLLIQIAVYVVLIRLVVVDTGALSWHRMGIRPASARSTRNFILGAAWALPTVFVTGVVAAALVSIFQVTPESPLPPATDRAGIVLNFIAGAVLAPIGEELFFRAFATTAWVMSFGARRGIIVGGLVFAFVHVLNVNAVTFEQGLPLAIIGFLTRVPIGLVLGFVFVRSRSIWTSIGLHSTFNTILLLIAQTSV
jgi:membrane protease YdiL (CAAX protease family)